MKWGKKKPHPSSSSFSSSPSSSSHSRPSFISHIFPTSWFSKIKLMPEDREHKPRKLTQKGMKNSDCANSPKNSCVDGGRFYSGDGDAFWRLSFGEDFHGGKQRRSVFNDSDDELELPNSSRRSKITKAGEDETQNFPSMRKTREVKNFSDGGKFGLERQMKAKIALKEHELNWRFRKMTTNPDRESTKSRDYKEEIAEDKESDSEWERMREKKKEEVKLRTEKQRKSIHISRELQGRRTKGSSKIKIYSPRTASKLEICKIKALEDMRKSKLKSQKKAREKMAERGRNLESFAVAKCSFDPHKDFRDSMIEMIMEKKMNRSEELEDLLACYLTLNSDEYHQLIINVFRQLWFDLNMNAVSAKLVDN